MTAGVRHSLSAFTVRLREDAGTQWRTVSATGLVLAGPGPCEAYADRISTPCLNGYTIPATGSAGAPPSAGVSGRRWGVRFAGGSGAGT
jgi:hypothetical protein